MHSFNCLQTYVYGQQTDVYNNHYPNKNIKTRAVDLVEAGCGRFFREGNTALCRASTPNWNSPLHIGVVSPEVSTRTRGPATLACKLQHSLLCSTARFGFTGCHCVLQLSERASEQETLNTLHIYTYMLA